MPKSVAAADRHVAFPEPPATEAFRHFGDGFAGKLVAARLQGYDSGSLSYIDVAVDGTGQLKSAASGGGGAVTVADGADVAQGATSDIAWVSGAGSLIAISKAEHAKLEAIRALLAGTLTVNTGLTDAQLRASAVPVTGPLTDAQLRASAVPVSAATLPLPAGAAQEHITAAGFHSVRLTDGAAFYDGRDITDRAARLLGVVSGGANVFHVDDNAASLTVDAPVGTPVFARLSDGAAALVGQKTAALSLPVVLASDVGLPTGANQIGTTLGPTLTKGTQGATGYSVQELKDAGRVNIMWTAEFAPAAVAEALLTVTESRDGAAVTTFTTKVVTNGKRLRITSIDLVVENLVGANPKRAKLRLRFNTAGAVTTASPLQGTWAASVATAVNTIGQTMFADFPDGIEYVGDGTKQIGWTLEFPDWVSAAQTGKVYITIFGFEY